MAEFNVRRAMSKRMTEAQQRDYERALRAATLASQDFPLLPTSDTNATPAIDPDDGDKLTPEQRLAVAAIIGGETFAAAARAAKVSPRTLYQWRQTYAFRQAVESRSREALDVVVVRVRNLMLRATRVLGDALLSDYPNRAPTSAIRVLNSPRLWAVARQAEEESPTDDEPAGESAAGESAVGPVADAVGNGAARPA